MLKVIIFSFSKATRAKSKMEKVKLESLSPSHQKQLNRLYNTARIMDVAFRIPFMKKYRWGYDGILGLLPGVGDSISFIVSLYWLWIARNLKLPLRIQLVILGRFVLDYLIGLLPFLGDIADIGYRAHVRNYKTVVRYLESGGG